jgi:asparagine synthase (glutamine-hydrolysing)
MSAIFGIINKKRQAIEDTDIEKVKKAIAHRAVDGSGVWKELYLMTG